MTIEAMIAELIDREGDYVDHPADRGGPTRWGITEQAARAFGYHGDMRSLPREMAAAIYRERYWMAPHFDMVAQHANAALAEELFDMGVNMGPGMAATLFQRALNVMNYEAKFYPDIVADGRVGRMTLAALDGFVQRRGRDEGLAVLLWAVRALRSARYIEIAEKNPTQEAFEYGWIARQVRMAA